ncbi:putative toxin YafO [Vibrio nigripulchritudo ATCC 27043]|uniref:type II toxin-antitoxin system YafO family toxin n=1 Tax=Vibrio nigripulchritudo TaxID=28173 RepID=UPI00021C1F75|nr:type II toxin-antitoxin system YafO family toxin [Vibrio nigripulchritudo]EGU57652.1 putative toxin YafO [Vibrio nigripulchritudo ATCC 27043]
MENEVKIFAYKAFKDSIPEEVYDAVKKKFRDYKSKGIVPNDFGRDTTFDFPEQLRQSGLKHIHIKDKTSKRWNLKKYAFDKTSNTALIYCSNYFNPNYYLLIGLIENAHQVYKEDLLYLLELSDIADRFSNRNF